MAKIRRIVCAANRYGDLIICGARHYDMVMHAAIKVIEYKYRDAREEQGFIDNNGEFLTREQAFWVALKAKQIRHKTGSNTPVLYSEDLY